MTLELPMHLQFPFEPASFWTQEAVRRCPSLKINLHRWVNAPHWALTSEQVVGWLSIHTGNSGKRMELEAPVLARSPGRLIDDLLEVCLLFLPKQPRPHRHYCITAKIRFIIALQARLCAEGLYGPNLDTLRKEPSRRAYQQRDQRRTSCICRRDEYDRRAQETIMRTSLLPVVSTYLPVK